MNEHTLSQRLERVAAHIPAGARLADIGSDHAYLPVALMRRGAIAAAVAGEVAATPFQAANRTVADNGLTQHITVRLADGLAAIEAGDDITAVSLCGMGGETIRDILDSGKARLNGRERLILQPNGGEQRLRQWLMDNGYRILHEELLLENRFYYEIIVAERAGAVAYTEEQVEELALPGVEALDQLEVAAADRVARRELRLRRGRDQVVAGRTRCGDLQGSLAAMLRCLPETDRHGVDTT